MKLSDRVRPGSEAAPWVIEEIKRMEAELEAKAAPVAYITGQFAGRCIIEPINRAAVLPTGMALYSHPQPSAGVVMPERKDDQGAPTVNLHIFREGWNACLDEFARLNGKEVGRG